MPLPLTVSCFSKIQIGFTFLVLVHPGSPAKGPLNRCVCVRACVSWLWNWTTQCHRDILHSCDYHISTVLCLWVGCWLMHIHRFFMHIHHCYSCVHRKELEHEKLRRSVDSCIFIDWFMHIQHCYFCVYRKELEYEKLLRSVAGSEEERQINERLSQLDTDINEIR